MTATPFNLNFNPPIDTAETLVPGLRRLVAPNASPMTFRGTNTYLLGETEIAVIDPGPDNAAHLSAIIDAVGDARKISHIIVTHSHVDHSPLARGLSDITGAPIYAFGDSMAGRSARMKRLSKDIELGGGEGVDAAFRPDITLGDGNRVQTREWALDAITTPGHFSNHLCFAWADTQSLFSGDHVMGWATTLVSPPDGDLTAFMASLEKLQRRTDDRYYYPGHGARLSSPQKMVTYQIFHRKNRESQILAALADGAATPMDLTRMIYVGTPVALYPAAARNVFSHLLDLLERKLVRAGDKISPESRFRLV